MKFRFRLQTLLKIRENARAEAQAELGKAREAERVVLEQLDEIRINIEKCANEGRKAIEYGKIDVNFMIGLRRHEAYLLSQDTVLKKHLEDVRAEIERRRQILMNADREVKTLEKLKEKQYEQFVEDYRAAEMKEMDEIANRRSRPGERKNVG